MRLKTESLIQQKRLRRSVMIWRIVAFVVAAIGLLSVLAALGQQNGAPSKLAYLRPHIAQISIQGFIGQDPELLELIDTLKDDHNVKAVILEIDSPGGSTSAGEALYEALNNLSEHKTVVAHIEAIGTSAAYMAALPAEYIVARRNAITGSIGVIAQFGNVEKLLEKLGIEAMEVRSGALKAQPSLFKTPSQKALNSLKAMIDDSFDWFVNIVAEHRGIPKQDIRNLEGDAFTGQQALDRGLIDAIGGQNVAIAWLQDEYGLSDNLPILTHHPKIKEQEPPFGAKALAVFLKATGHSQNAATQTLQQLKHQGLLSIWHGS